jgi:hypothetical protein
VPLVLYLSICVLASTRLIVVVSVGLGYALAVNLQVNRIQQSASTRSFEPELEEEVANVHVPQEQPALEPKPEDNTMTFAEYKKAQASNKEKVMDREVENEFAGASLRP